MAVDRIFYVDPFLDTSFSYDGKELLPETVLPKKAFISSRVFYDDIVSHSFKVSKDTPVEEIGSSVELRMYEDVGLDLQKEYKITHVVKELEFEEMLLVEAFAIEKENVTQRLGNVLKKTKYIDFLILPFLSFSTLYTNKIIAPKNDIFIYMEPHEAFLAIYKDGKYLSTKSLMTLGEILQALQKESIDIDMEGLEQILQEKGLDAQAYGREDAEVFRALESIFSDIFTKVNNIIIHNRSIFGFEKVDRLFLSTHFGRIKGLKTLLQNFFSSEMEALDFNLFPQKQKSNFFAMVLASYGYDIANKPVVPLDITFFKRGAPFSQTQAGKFILFGVVALLLASAYPLYLTFEIQALEKERLEVKQNLDAIKASTKKINQELTEERRELSSARKELEQNEQRVENITKSIYNLYDVKKASTTTSDFFYSVNSVLQKYNLKTRSITLNETDRMSIEVFSTKNKRDTIAKFMEELIKKGYVQVGTKEIKLDGDVYISLVEISR